MKKYLFLVLVTVLTCRINAQSGYDIQFKIKGSTDTMVFLVKYVFDQKYIVDTCKNVKKGEIRFKGKTSLDPGVYMLVNQGKAPYFDFFINENQKFLVEGDLTNMVNTLKAKGNKENELFFSYVKFFTGKNNEFKSLSEQVKGKSGNDSAEFMSQKLKSMNSEVRSFESGFLKEVKGTYLFDVINIKSEKAPAEIPLAKNGRPDSIFQYYYYKNHYLEGINFKDERLIRSPFFADRIKSYFDRVIVNHPDTVIKEMDKILLSCVEGGLTYNTLLAHFTYTSEQNKIMGFDKVFVHLGDKYIVSGHAKGVYTEENTKKIKERIDIMRNLLLDSKVPDLLMIDTVYAANVLKMGFDTAKTSSGVTDLYNRNLKALTPMFKSLYNVKAKYTVLVFWAADCGHCQTEIPSLNEGLKELKGKVDFKVYAVQTKDELLPSWKKFIVENKMNDFINVFDPIHLNNLKDQFDIYSTPVIYILDSEKRIKAKRLDAGQVVQILGAWENVPLSEKSEKKKS